MLPGYPDAPLWLVIWLYIVGGMLLFFGMMGRGRHRVIAVLAGLAVLGYALAPVATKALDRHPEAKDCIEGAWATGSLACKKPQ